MKIQNTRSTLPSRLIDTCLHSLANARTGRWRLFFLLLAGFSFGPAFAVFGQLQWSSYNTSGALVTTNVAAGGDAGFGGSVTLNIPAGTELVFMTKTFVPKSIAAASSSAKINFNMSANGGLYPGSTGRLLGMGLLNDGGTASALDDTGYWADFNTGNPSWELFQRLSTVATFFQYDSADKLGSGKTAMGYPSNNVAYGMQFQLNMNSSANSISIGTSASTWAACGAGMTNGDGAVNQLGYSSGVALTTLPTTTFNEFAFMFDNTSASSVNVTLSGITLAPANAEITSAPISFSGSAGSTAAFTVVVNTNAVTPIGYQWYETNGSGVVALADGSTGNGSTISGSSVTGSILFTNTLTFNNAQLADANGSLFVVMTNAYGSVTSAPVVLNILPPTQPTNLVVSPDYVTVVAGQGTNFTVSSLASPSPTYYWYDNNDNLLQSGSALTLTLSNLQLANAGTYSVVSSNDLGAATNYFIVNVIVPPCISQQPSNVLVNAGDSVNFYVAEGGCASPAPTYQWYKNGVLISGATATNYSIASVALTDIATYTVVVGNTAGSVTSAGAKLAIYSTVISGTPVLPAPNDTGVCYDTYLQISFNQAPAVGNAGKVYIYDASNPAAPVDTIDMSLNNALGVQARSLFAGDSQAFNYYPVVVTGNTATIYPHSGVLTTNKTYYVTMDPGVIVDSTGAYFTGISSSTVWQFTTKPSGPVNATNLVVDATGSGDFVTVQGAVDSIPLHNTNYTLIKIHDGNYFEIVDIASKNNVTFRGQSRNGTLVGYPNNANIAPGGTTHARMAFKIDANNIAIENMTVTNRTPQGGSQAEALMIESGAGRFILNNAEVDSRQDTILANVNSSQGYFYNSLVQGNYDYVWGGGNLFFTNCELRTIAGSSQDNFAAPRTDNGVAGNWPGYSGLLVSNGFSFASCQLTRQSGTVPCSMSDANGSPNGLAAWINCSIDTDTDGYTNALSSAYTTQLLWEYGCSNLNNTIALNSSATPFIGFTQLNNGDPRLLAAQNAVVWLNGWVPQLAPNILTNPVSQSVSGGGSATFTVAATGISDPTYQWLKNGSPMNGQTGTSLTISSASANDVASYSVIVSNSAGVVASSGANLAVGNIAPALAPVSDLTVGVGAYVSVTNIATDPDLPAQTLVFSQVAGPGSVDPNSGIYTWRPPVASAGSSNNILVVVTDNGTPSLSATNSFNIIVNPVAQPATSAATYANGQFSLTVSGDLGPDYILQGSTNLVDWQNLLTNSSPTTPFTFTDTNAGSVPVQFYRILLGP